MRHSEQLNEISAALALAQADMTVAAFDSQNPAFRSKYASLSAVTAAIRGPLTRHGVAFLQSVHESDAGVRVSTRLLHKSGQWIESDGPLIPVDKNNAHGAMSACTYAKRASLSMAVAIPSDEDDDGNAAAGAPAQVSAETQAWLKAIAEADPAALSDIGGELAKATVPVSEKALLREAFGKRRQALSKTGTYVVVK